MLISVVKQIHEQGHRLILQWNQRQPATDNLMALHTAKCAYTHLTKIGIQKYIQLPMRYKQLDHKNK